MVSFALDTVKFLLTYRYLQNTYWFKREEFRTLIDSTEDKELVEYSTWWDSFWGACDTVSELNKNWSEGDIKGINLTGRAMMTMRQYRSIILNHPIAAPYDFVHECDFQICGRKIEPV